MSPLSVYVPGQTNPTTGLYEGHYYRAPTDAEVLAHPAALAEVQRLTGKVDRLTAERTEALTLIAAAGDYVHDQIGPVGLVDAVNNLITDTDELRRQGWRDDADADRWHTIRDEVHRLDALVRPGAVMADDDVVDCVIRALRSVAKGGSNG